MSELPTRATLPYGVHESSRIPYDILQNIFQKRLPRLRHH
jgi:hypothetical protein